MSEGGEARNHEAEREAVARALAFEDADNPEMWDWQGADAVLAALDALRRSPTAEDAVRLAYEDGVRAGREGHGA